MKSNLFGDVDLFSEDEGIEISESKSKAGEEEATVEKTPPKKVNDKDDGFIEVVSKSKKEKVVEETAEENEIWDPYKDPMDIEEETPPNDTKSNSSSSPFKPFAKALYEEGFLSSFTDEEFEKLSEEAGGEAEALIELTKRTIQGEIEEYKKTAEEEYKSFLEAREAGVDLNKWNEIKEAGKNYSSISEESLEEDESLQKKIMTDYLKEKGFSKEEIDETIESLEDTAKLELRAKSALKNLKAAQAKKEEALKLEVKQQEEERARQYKETVNSLKKTIYESPDTVLPGIKLTKKLQDAIYKNIMDPVKELSNGEKINAIVAKRLENPVKYAIIEAYLVEIGVFDGKFDKIEDKVKGKALLELKKTLENSKNTSFKQGKQTVEDVGDNWKLPDL